MKKNTVILFAILCFINALYPTPAKIKQMLFVSKEDTHDKKSDCIYYVTQDNQLYCTNTESLEVLEEDRLELYEFYKPFKGETKLSYYEKIADNRIVLIGQPVYINETWTMPAVIKKPGFIGNILRPDIYTIEYKEVTVLTDTIKRDLSKKIEQNSNMLSNIAGNVMDDVFEDDKDKKKTLVITKQYEGHRTKVVKVGISKTDNDSVYILASGSEWPTIKEKNYLEKSPRDIKDSYLFDINKNNNYQASAYKSFFKKDKWTFTLQVDSTEETISMVYLPNITFDPKLDTNNQQTDLLDALKLQKDLNKKDYLFYSKNYKLLIDTTSSREKLKLYNKKSGKKNSFEFIGETTTACTFDFANKKPFCALYNTKKGTARIINIISDILSDDTYNEGGESLQL